MTAPHPCPRRGSVAPFRGLTVLCLASALSAAASSFPAVDQLPPRPDLPDPLAMLDGRKIVTARQWEKERRPELKALFQHYMYGPMPPKPTGMKFTVDHSDTRALGGKATLKVVNLIPGQDAPSIQLLVLTPNRRQGLVPAFVGLNFCGNHTALADPSIPLPPGWMPSSCRGCTNNRATEASRGTQVDTWCIEQSIDRGYAVALLYNGDVEPDRAGATGGLRAWFSRRERHEDWGNIALWAWGMSRALDYVVKDQAIDPRRVAAVGHSRNGKAAMVAAAFDERFALAIPLQAGCGGTAPSRGKVGESVKQINDRFPHWFNANFKRFNDQPDRLPFDQHCLVALCAPRPVLLPNAVEDTWANPDGQFEMLQAADRVYRLLDVEGLGAASRPEVGRVVASRLGYWIRPGRHSMTRDDWQVFLDFADRHLRSAR